MEGLDAERILDPTTAGDFLRRFGSTDVVALMDAVNEIRPKLWRERLSRSERREALLDVDGIVAPTTGECKEGMDISYKRSVGIPSADRVAGEHIRTAVLGEPLGQSSVARWGGGVGEGCATN